MSPRPDTVRIDRNARLGAPPVGTPKQIPSVRVRNFDEVFLPWTPEMVKVEAARCLHCPSTPCVDACPLHNDIPSALRLAEQGSFERAAEVFLGTSNFPEICSRLCTQSVQCESACPHMKAGRPPVAIGRIETFLADHYWNENGWSADRPAPSGKRVAVVGAGPAGLAVSEILAGKGHGVTVYEQWPDGGGSLRYGIPRFRLDHGLVRDRLKYLKTLGVEFVFNTRIEDGAEIKAFLGTGFEAVFLGTGVGSPAEVAIPGRGLRGVHDGRSFLVRANVEQDLRPSDLEDPPYLGRSVIVIGDGDTALDCGRTALRLGALEVTCVSDRAEQDFSGDPRRKELAREEGAKLEWLTAARRILGDQRGSVRGVEVSRLAAAGSRPLSAGRGRDEADEASLREELVPIAADTVIVVSDVRPDRTFLDNIGGLRVSTEGLIVTESATGQTSLPGIWAGGENVLGPSPVARSVAQARTAAADILHALHTLD